MAVDRLVKGPDTGTGPSGTWTIVSGKMEGVAPGFTIRDGAGQLYFIKFDPPSNPEMASGAEVISTKFFHAFGYHVPENYIATVRRDALVIGEDARIEDDNGRRRQMDLSDLESLLKRGARNTDGSYRVLASKALEGKPVGPFRYYGTRPDDPNDIFPHEHRRELRGLLVFCAWLNHDDSRSINSLDTLVSAGGRTIVRHHLLDFGSTLGSGTTQAQSRRAGNEFLWESRPTLHHDAHARLLRAPVDQGALSRDPRARPHRGGLLHARGSGSRNTPTPPSPTRAPRIASGPPASSPASRDEGVRAVIGTAQFSDSKASAYLTETLLDAQAQGDRRAG